MKQDQIGEEERPAPLQLPGRSLELLSNGQPRGMVASLQCVFASLRGEDALLTGTETGLQTAQVCFDFVPRYWPAAFAVVVSRDASADPDPFAGAPTIWLL